MTAQAGAVAACPFCGGEAEVRHAYQWWIECTECGAGSPASAPMDEAGAIAAWNRRTPAAVPVEALEGLVKIMGEFLDAEWTPELDTIQQWRDELTQLIKERSNG